MHKRYNSLDQSLSTSNCRTSPKTSNERVQQTSVLALSFNIKHVVCSQSLFVSLAISSRQVTANFKAAPLSPQFSCR
jgi:hypothetical protein